MSRGGFRPGAGRPKKSELSPHVLNEMRAKINSNQIVRRLQNHIKDPERNPLPGSAVTAALGLLRKVLPDLAAVEIENEGPT